MTQGSNLILLHCMQAGSLPPEPQGKPKSVTQAQPCSLLGSGFTAFCCTQVESQGQRHLSLFQNEDHCYGLKDYLLGLPNCSSAPCLSSDSFSQLLPVESSPAGFSPRHQFDRRFLSRPISLALICSSPLTHRKLSHPPFPYPGTLSWKLASACVHTCYLCTCKSRTPGADTKLILRN